MEELFQIIRNHSRKTGRASGLSVPQAFEESGMNLGDFVHSVGELQEQGRIYLREGINHTLLFASNDPSEGGEKRMNTNANSNIKS